MKSIPRFKATETAGTCAEVSGCSLVEWESGALRYEVPVPLPVCYWPCSVFVWKLQLFPNHTLVWRVLILVKPRMGEKGEYVSLEYSLTD